MTQRGFEMRQKSPHHSDAVLDLGKPRVMACRRQLSAGHDVDLVTQECEGRADLFFELPLNGRDVFNRLASVIRCERLEHRKVPAMVRESKRHDRNGGDARMN